MTDPEDLRRRLYRPDAGPEALAEYLAAAPRAANEEEAAGGLLTDTAAPPSSTPAPRRLRPRTVVAIAAVSAVALAGAIGVLRGTAPAPPPAAAPVTAAAAGPTPLPTAEVEPATRIALVRRLERGSGAGFGAWLRMVDGGSVPSERFREGHGTGLGTIAVPPAPDGPAQAGRLAVLLVVAADGTAGWTTDRLDVHANGSAHREAVTTAYGAVRAGVPVVGVVDFAAGRRPDRVRVDVPAGVAWGAAVVLDRRS